MPCRGSEECESFIVQVVRLDRVCGVGWEIMRSIHVGSFGDGQNSSNVFIDRLVYLDISVLTAFKCQFHG